MPRGAPCKGAFEVRDPSPPSIEGMAPVVRGPAGAPATAEVRQPGDHIPAFPGRRSVYAPPPLPFLRGIHNPRAPTDPRPRICGLSYLISPTRESSRPRRPLSSPQYTERAISPRAALPHPAIWSALEAA